MRPTATLVLCALLAFAPPAWAEDDAASIARRASDLLSQAALALSEAEGSGAEIRALTETVRAYELGLTALRQGLRQAAAEERQVRERLAPRTRALSDLTVVLYTQARLGTARTLAHPGGALDRLRAAGAASAMVPAVGEEVDAMSADLASIDALAQLQRAALRQLEDGAEGIREARTALANAIAERDDRPEPLATDTAAMEALINSTETLSAFADTLVGGGEASGNDSGSLWELPVRGQVRRGYKEPDAAGVTRPGWVVETPPLALVTAPALSTIRFEGTLPGQGHVVILEPAPGKTMILAGLGEVFVARGDIVSAGDPIGLMPGTEADANQNLIEDPLAGGQRGTETLYIETRRAQAPMDPADRFRRSTEEG
ncbi:peptidoglycan DD-metalloendopeptidase family protein [Alphaproteobacteria bacterium GH1-50]|uniref:Peptidoglycan DD-metalloendopeptidase family protein n=1 Tax=Kangsaoukella pontilimi TaxID=2691042 RepID=A0A7C9IPY6_9RHOB|nr:peptidoglycan DD-metalloendopeptidase family protein [Kangsaoukella pontilimi]MXQ08590.1 peptidoglycan DD-metalloendopeptidase family protein [Kangsaoukella pontilimi]